MVAKVERLAGYGVSVTLSIHHLHVLAVVGSVGTYHVELSSLDDGSTVVQGHILEHYLIGIVRVETVGRCHLSALAERAAHLCCRQSHRQEKRVPLLVPELTLQVDGELCVVLTVGISVLRLLGLGVAQHERALAQIVEAHLVDGGVVAAYICAAGNIEADVYLYILVASFVTCGTCFNERLWHIEVVVVDVLVVEEVQSGQDVVGCAALVLVEVVHGFVAVAVGQRNISRLIAVGLVRLGGSCQFLLAQGLSRNLGIHIHVAVLVHVGEAVAAEAIYAACIASCLLRQLAVVNDAGMEQLAGELAVAKCVLLEHSVGLLRPLLGVAAGKLVVVEHERTVNVSTAVHLV